MNKCDGKCPTPGKCDTCNIALFNELIADEAILSTYDEWLRTSGPIEENNMQEMYESWACGHEIMTYVLESKKPGQNQYRYYSGLCSACYQESQRFVIKMALDGKI